MIYYYIICAIVGYLIGSIPFGYIIVKLKKGIDIRTVGSGNIGATNVGRVIGWPWGILCFLLDAGKGFVSTVLIPYLILSHTYPEPQRIIRPEGTLPFCGTPYVAYMSERMQVLKELSLLVGLFVIIGHLFPCYLRFKGGKGVATALGVFIFLLPVPTLITVVIWLLFLVTMRYVSLASIMAAVALPLTYYYYLTCYIWPLTSYDWFYKPIALYLSNYVAAFLVLISLLIIIKHIPNIKRLIKGTEPKVKLWGKKPQINTDEHR